MLEIRACHVFSSSRFYRHVIPPTILGGNVWIVADVPAGQFSELAVSWLAAGVEIRVF
jgi:hypothetical protein